MTIDQLVHMAERIHDAEGWDLGASSTRDYRNAFWARAVGCAYWGHPTYNAAPDKQWHIKKKDAGSPQSDDVAVSMPTRNAWDCIPGAGANGYSFEAHGIGALPTDQIVYAPPVPQGHAPGPQPEPPPTGQPYPDEQTWWPQVFDVEVSKRYALKGITYPDNARAFRWASRTAYDIADGMTKENSLAKHLKELEQELGL